MLNLAEQSESYAIDVKGLFQVLSRRFRDAGLATPELDARLLINRACKLTSEAFVLFSEQIVANNELILIEAFAKRRLDGEPVSRILGEREFWSLPFLLSPATLDPRADTETLVTHVLSVLPAQECKDKPLRILDLGTGTGCILLSLLSEYPRASGIGTDLSVAALDMARKNAQRLGFSNRVSFVAGNWLEPISGSFDIIISNPPYIRRDEIKALAPQVAKYDPHLALDGGDDGLLAYRSFIPELPRVLAPAGLVFLEIGDGQQNIVAKLLKLANFDSSFEKFTFKQDLCGKVRSVAGRLRR